MYRVVALLLFAAGSLLAAPAPFPRPEGRSGPWHDGWARPVGPGRFDRDRDRLTITSTGKATASDVDVEGRLMVSPHLLREVEGDFIAQVRVDSGFHLMGRVEGTVCRHAGLMVRYGKTFTSLTAGGFEADGGIRFTTAEPDLRHQQRNCLDVPEAVFLALERRGDRMQAAFSFSGRSWRALGQPAWLDLPWKLRVGVFAEATAPGTFKAVFDQFKLTPLGGKAK
jgi:regulation of enolase protein 1 (concanavalin A-like superfamily)